MANADGHNLPLCIGTASASPPATQAVEAALTQNIIRSVPLRIIGDKPPNADDLDHQPWEERSL